MAWRAPLSALTGVAILFGVGSLNPSAAEAESLPWIAHTSAPTTSPPAAHFASLVGSGGRQASSERTTGAEPPVLAVPTGPVRQETEENQMQASSSSACVVMENLSAAGDADTRTAISGDAADSRTDAGKAVTRPPAVATSGAELTGPNIPSPECDAERQAQVAAFNEQRRKEQHPYLHAQEREEATMRERAAAAEREFRQQQQQQSAPATVPTGGEPQRLEPPR